MAKEKSERELIYGEYYLIDEKKCLYKSIEDDGIYYRIKGGKAWVRQNARSADDNSAWPGPPITFSRRK
jgi:hypothetical protein